MKNKKTIFLSIVMSIAPYIMLKDASAVGAISRACQFNKIPPSLQNLSSDFFIAVGAPVDLIRKIISIENPTIDPKYWILESLTTNYLNNQYYLYAVSDQYTSGIEGGARSFIWFRRFNSPGWGAQEISKDMRESDKWKIFYANRGIWMSQRAGVSTIVEDASPFYKPNEDHSFAVRGQHYYYDPVSKTTVRLKDTVAIDCNMKDFGVKDKGLFDR
jgi:hypothetical protein